MLDVGCWMRCWLVWCVLVCWLVCWLFPSSVSLVVDLVRVSVRECEWCVVGFGFGFGWLHPLWWLGGRGDSNKRHTTYKETNTNTNANTLTNANTNPTKTRGFSRAKVGAVRSPESMVFSVWTTLDELGCCLLLYK